MRYVETDQAEQSPDQKGGGVEDELESAVDHEHGLEHLLAEPDHRRHNRVANDMVRATAALPSPAANKLERGADDHIDDVKDGDDREDDLLDRVERLECL